MGRMGELADAVSELKRCGEILIGISETLIELLVAAEPEKQWETPKKTKTAKKEKQLEARPLTLEEVRAVLAEKSRSGHTEEVMELLAKHGADKLSEIDPAEYAVLLAEAEVL